MKNLFLVSALAILSMACGGSSTSPLPSVISINPSHADISAIPSLKAGSNSLGDSVEIMSVKVSTNMPESVRLLMHLTSPGPYYQPNPSPNLSKCIENGCLVKNGAESTFEWNCPKACPNGAYKLTFTACSYVDPTSAPPQLPCRGQEAGYLKWVGNLGANLASNPNTLPDSTHSSILNFSKSISFGRSSDGKIANSAEIASAAAHASVISSSTTPLQNLTDLCYQDVYSASCQMRLQGQIDLINHSISAIHAASLPCSTQADNALVHTLDMYKASYTTMLEGSKAKNDTIYVNGARALPDIAFNMKQQAHLASISCP